MAGAISGLALAFGLEDKEKNLLKLFIYPLALRCIGDKLLEKGILPTLPHGGVISYMIICSVITYGYTVERHSQPGSMFRMIDSYAMLTDVENRHMNIFRT